MDNADAIEQHARTHVDFLLGNSPLYHHLFSDIVVISATNKRVVVRLPVKAIHTNSKNTLHGSVSCAIVDFIGGLAIACSDLRRNTGVSTDMQISFAGSATAGDTLDIEGRAEKVGGTLAFTRATIRKFDEAKQPEEYPLVAMGTHTKFVRTRS